MPDAPDALPDAARLNAARQGAARLEEIDAMLRHLEAERQALTEKAQELSSICDIEYDEADRLDSGRLISAFHSLLGDLDERRKKERAEALAAQLKYNAALKDLRAMREQMERLAAEREKYVGCPAEFKRLSEQKRAALLEEHGAPGEAIADKREKIARLEIRIKELTEALDAGNLVLLRLSRASASFGSGYWGRGILTSVLADQINASMVLSTLGSIQTLVREFKTQMADVKKLADIRHGSENYSQFAAVFYENVIKDAMASDTMMRSYDHVMNLKSQVGSVMQKLRLMKLEDTRKVKELKAELGIQNTLDSGGQKGQSDSSPGKGIEGLQTAIQETDALIDTGCDILLSLERVLERISSAERLGWLDIADPTHVSGIVKHAELNAARAEADRTFMLLLKFQNALPLTLPTLDLTFGFTSANEFTDIYMDCLTADLSARAKIMNAKARLNSLKEQVEGAMRLLSDRKAELSEELLQLQY